MDSRAAHLPETAGMSPGAGTSVSVPLLFHHRIIMVLTRDHQHIYFSINIFSKHKTPLQKHQTWHSLGMGRPGFFVYLSESPPYSEAMCVFIPTDLAHIVQVRLSKAFKYFSVS